MNFKYIYLTIIFLGIIIFYSCEKAFIGEVPENTNINNFEIFWNDYDQHYGRFVYKNVNWDSIYNVYRPIVNDDLTDHQFFNILERMISNLKDGHAILESGFRVYGYSYNRSGINFNMYNITHNYLIDTNFNGPFTYGLLDGNIAYLYILDFKYDYDTYLFIDDFLELYSDVNGIIIDVRSNGGGNEGSAKIIASRFIDKKHTYKYNYYRTGTDYNDVENYKATISPAGEFKYLDDIVVLQDQYTGSAGEDFILMMKVVPNATIIGDYSSGNAGGCPLTRELLNGWIYRIPTCLQTSVDGVPFEGIGIKPDIQVLFSAGDVLFGKDAILEKAIEMLN